MEKTKINENEKGENVMILDGKYELGRVIGHGSFAKVYLAKNVKTGQSLAMKIINKDKVKNLGQMEQIKREISVMNMVKHPNIVELYEVMASKKKIYLAMELVKGGELFAKIVRGRMREDVARNYFQQLISAVDFCHSRGVYHRDLKPENLMLDEDGNLKVTDFGLSALNEEWRKDGLLHTTCGTPAYVAPEVLRKKGYDGAKADVWSCGVILYALLAGFLPFQDHNLVGVYTKICKGEFKCPSWFSSDSKKIVHRLLDCNPETRINIGKLMESNWFQKGLAKKGEEKAVEEKNGDKGKEPQTMNAFHLISFSKGFNLSGLFQKKEKVEKEEIRFGTLKPVRSVISKLEELAKGVEFNVKKTDSKVRLEAKEYGRKGKLGVAAEFYPVTPLFLVVEVKKERGDTLEYNDFCKELRPALKDIVWSSLQDNEISACNQD